jgi:hypothetical protein
VDRARGRGSGGRSVQHADSRGRNYRELIDDAKANVESIAKRERCSARQVNMTISLAFLAPALVKAAIEGRLPRGIGVTRLRDAPADAAQHAWSGFSRHALWAMATSSWASQFASTGRQLGDETAAVRQARAMFKLTPEIARAAPELYEVSHAGRVRTFQKMRACCLHFKNSERRFCANCPIIPEAERLARNRAWLESPTA